MNRNKKNMRENMTQSSILVISIIYLVISCSLEQDMTIILNALHKNRAHNLIEHTHAS